VFLPFFPFFLVLKEWMPVFAKKPTFFKVFLHKICNKLATTKITGNWGPQRFFNWRIFAKFRPQKYDFAIYKGFFKKKSPNLPIFEDFFFQIARF